MKYPISHGAGRISDFFYKIMSFHIPSGKILDPTCGEKKLLWSSFFRYTLKGRPIDRYEKVIFSDIQDFGQDIVSDIKNLKFNNEFDGIVYDPPYLFECNKTSYDTRDIYGKYTQSYDKLIWFMEVANSKFPKWLKNSGKVIVKCSDQFHVKKKMFYPLHIEWIKQMNSFSLCDIFVFCHNHVNPTAWQVKDRPCSVIMHTYFLIFEMKKKERKFVRQNREL